jgi:chromosome segregation ATPase
MPFRVEDFHDLIRLLEAQPEWRAELRRLLLTDALLALPERLAELRADTDRRFQELIEAQQRTETQVAALTQRVTSLAEAQQRTETQLTSLAEAQQRTETQLAVLTRVVQTLTDNVGELKGDNLSAATVKGLGRILVVCYVACGCSPWRNCPSCWTRQSPEVPSLTPKRKR